MNLDEMRLDLAKKEVDSILLLLRFYMVPCTNYLAIAYKNC